jgi:hypothetical protein
MIPVKRPNAEAQWMYAGHKNTVRVVATMGLNIPCLESKKRALSWRISMR